MNNLLDLHDNFKGKFSIDCKTSIFTSGRILRNLNP